MDLLDQKKYEKLKEECSVLETIFFEVQSLQEKIKVVSANWLFGMGEDFEGIYLQLKSVEKYTSSELEKRISKIANIIMETINENQK